MHSSEFQLPPLSSTERLTFGVTDVLKGVEWDPRPESGLEVRSLRVPLPDEGWITVKQTRTPSIDPVTRNSVRLELYDRQFLAAWMTGRSNLHINDFEYTDDIERALHEANTLIHPEQDGEA